MATGLRDEIDELDQLLDKLLQLPIERATASSAPAVLPMKPAVATLALHHEEEMEESEAAVLTLPVPQNDEGEDQLRIVRSSAIDVEFNQASRSETDLSSNNDSAPSLPLPLTKGEPEGVEAGDGLVIPTTTSNMGQPSTADPCHNTPSFIVTDPVPWLDDEPLPVPSISSGPKVEIIQGPHSEVVVASSTSNTESKLPAAKRSILFWVLWTWTWLFDQSLGRWFPFLRRPNVKFLLGLVGVALFAVSIYIVWQGFTR